MYRIKLGSGDETTYESIDDLTAAVQNGVVNAEALIYHQRADRWLSVTNHPHYLIALNRANGTSNGAPKPDASKRQVISAVRPPESQPPATKVTSRPEVPQTGARAQLFEVVAEMEKEKAAEAKPATRKLTIPQPRKPETTSPLVAYENVLEGVEVTKPKPAHDVTGNGHAPTNGNGAAPAKSQTAVLPSRSAQPLVKPTPMVETPKVLDLGDGLDLVEVGELTPPAPEREPVSETPQVDKLLQLLDPVAPPAPVPTAAAPAKVEPVEIIELKEAPRQEAAEPVFNSPVHHVAEKAPHAASHPVAPRKTRNNIVLIGISAAAVVALAGGLFIFKPWAGKKDQPSADTLASAAVPRTEAFGGLSSVESPPSSQSSDTVSTGAIHPTRSTKAVDSAPAIVRVTAPRSLNVKLPSANLIAAGIPQAHSEISASILIQHYNAAFTSARSQLELRMLQIGFTQIFLRSRLTKNSGVQDARRLIASAGTALRQYRAEEAQIDRSYQDTVGVAGRNLGWGSRDLGTWNAKTSQRETAETMRLTTLMLTQMDSVYSLLAAQDGEYQLLGDGIVFDNAGAAQQYGALRGWLNQQADNYAGSGDALPATLRQVIKAIGAGRLPQERKR
jgi:hypothetical protein